MAWTASRLWIERRWRARSTCCLPALSTRPAAYFGALSLALRHRIPGLKALLYSLFYFVEAVVLSRELMRREVTHLHNHFANPGANVGLIASKLLGIPWSVTLHGISEFDYPAGPLLPEKLTAASFVACVSHFGRAQAMRIVDPSLWNKMAIVRCGIETAMLPTRATEPRETLHVLCVGRLSPEKGHTGLLDAFARVLNAGIHAELRLLGDGPERARIEAKIAELGINGHVVMRGQQPDTEVMAELAHADVLVMASFMEGLPVVLMEALGAGVPVVAPRVAGIPELAVDGETALLFHPGDFDGLAQQLTALLSDAALRERLGSAGQRRVMAEFDADVACMPLLARFSVVTTPQRP
jgi:colanic acid/amylovoran biosynthesis glycosyltransferase